MAKDKQKAEAKLLNLRKRKALADLFKHLTIIGTEGRKESFYLTTHSTHFVYGYMASGYMVKDHSDSEKGNPLLPHRLLLSISSKGSFFMHHPTDRIPHTTAFVTPVVEHWLEREIAQWVHPMKDRSDDPSHHERTLLPRSYISLPGWIWKKVTASKRLNLCCLWHFFKLFWNIHLTRALIYVHVMTIGKKTTICSCDIWFVF